MKVLNKIKWLTFGGSLLVSMAFMPAPLVPVDLAEDDINACTITNTTFRAGEQISYKVYYNLNFVWIPAGEVVFNVEGMDGQYHISAVGNTYKSYEWFFKVRDRYDSYIDAETLLPYLSIRDVQEGGYTLYEKTTFNQGKSKARVVRGRAIDNIKEDKEYPISTCMHDMLSILYYARNLNYTNYNSGHRFPMDIFMDKEEWPLSVEYLGKEEEVKIKGLGHFNTIMFSPQLIAGDVFPEDAQMKVWVSDDLNKIPVMIESPLSVGSIKVVLQDYSGLRYEMGAKVN
ncbi:MAG: DUF3108 domain-containing protein [Saprospiraceae bacterium]|nr:DUF3108 domain-containing protein [Saprospiraceae bacterium]